MSKALNNPLTEEQLERRRAFIRKSSFQGHVIPSLVCEATLALEDSLRAMLNSLPSVRERVLIAQQIGLKTLSHRCCWDLWMEDRRESGEPLEPGFDVFPVETFEPEGDQEARRKLCMRSVVIHDKGISRVAAMVAIALEDLIFSWLHSFTDWEDQRTIAIYLSAVCEEYWGGVDLVWDNFD